MSEWKEIEEHSPKHTLKDRQKVDLFLHRHDISGPNSFRLTDCYYDAELNLFLTEDHRIVNRVYEYHITHYRKIDHPNNP